MYNFVVLFVIFRVNVLTLRLLRNSFEKAIQKITGALKMKVRFLNNNNCLHVFPLERDCCVNYNIS